MSIEPASEKKPSPAPDLTAQMARAVAREKLRQKRLREREEA